METLNPYLRHIPEKVVQVTQKISDKTLLKTFREVDAKINPLEREDLKVPEIGLDNLTNMHTVWSWLVDLVKARHTEEWEAKDEAIYDQITEKAAKVQGVPVEEVNVQAIPYEEFDAHPGALAVALEVLEAHAKKPYKWVK